jgi:phosphoglycerol transferase MdoB-like AlkP superfamily enzyme
MKAYKQKVILLLKQLLLVFVMYFLCRVVFLISCHSYFLNLNAWEILKLFFYGIRFDAFSIAVSNILFITISLQPFLFANNYWLQKTNNFLFLVFNSLFLLTNCIDFGYYPFIRKRSTFDTLNQLFGGQIDVKTLLPSFITDYWYVLLLYIILIYVFVKAHNYLLRSNTPLTGNYTGFQKLQISVVSLVIVGLSFVSFRGLARVPIQFIDAGKYASANYIDIVINTPFSILLTMDKTNLSEIQVVDEQVAFNTVNPIKEHKSKTLTKKNVVIIILESFSKEYTGLGKRKSYTPFLDSLMQHSLVYNNALANAATSIEGIPAILSSFPNLMPNPYINSSYSGNQLASIAALLKDEGYQTSFFHGGTNGTMNFDSYANLSGFTNYYGRTEYDNELDFDNNWGIWDEPFLQYTAKTVSTYSSPFLAAIFTLSSHHPFKVPEKYANKFPKTSLEIIESIGYTDYALANFFESAKKTAWYNNTIFILTPDHTSISEDNFYNNDVGHRQIPIIFFSPSDTSLKGFNNKLIQQIDIMPSVLDYIGYNKPYFAFGNSVFGNKPSKYSIHFNSGSYYLTNDSMYYVFNNLNLEQVFNYKKDSLLTQNLFDSSDKYRQQENYLKSYIQFYNKTVINNKTHL